MIIGVHADNALETGGNAETLYDISGNGNDLTQATSTKRPSIATWRNGRKAMTFDGSDDTLRRSTFVGGAVAQPYTAFVVCQWPSSAPGADKYITSASVRADFYCLSGTLKAGYVAGAAFDSGITIAANAPVVLCCMASGTSSDYYVSPDGAARSQTLNGSPGTSSPSGITLGSYIDSGFYWPSKIASYHMYSGELTALQIDKMRQYLQGYYNINPT
jgi:hypothetical protein